MAYATIAGLPVEVGFYTAFIPMVIYAILGTSRPLSFSTTSTIAILVAAQLATLGPGGDPGRLILAASRLALLVGPSCSWPVSFGWALSPTLSPTRS